LVLGAGDYATGGDGGDEFVLSGWSAGGPVAQIADFDPAKDRLVVVFDGAAQPDAEVTVEAAEDGARSILVDGSVVAVVKGGAFTAADVNVVRPEQL
jgi:hypothetical protein